MTAPGPLTTLVKSAAKDLTLVDPPLYDPVFFDRGEEGVRRSAAVMVPLLADLLEPGSVLDVGCPTDLWLGALRAARRA